MMPTQMQLHMASQVPNQSQQPPQAQQQPPSQTQQTSQIPHSQQNQQYLSAHSQADQNQRNGLKQREQSLFSSYVYDFLKRSGATETARMYLREGGDIKTKNDNTNSINGNGTSSDNDAQLPDAEVPVQAPEGFLYEWWTVFWDIYSAKLHRPGSMDAQRYVAAEMRRSGRMIGQIPMTYPHQVVAAQQAQQAQHQQQLRLQMQQHPQHQQPQAQQVSQQAAQQQQQQQSQQPPQQQPPQQPQQPQQTQQPQPQPSPANHQQVTHQQPHQQGQFNSNRIVSLDTSNPNGDVLSPQRANAVKVTPQQTVMRRPLNNIPIPRGMMLQQLQQHQHQLHSVQAQAQNTQPIQNQVQQQNPGVNQGQVQQTSIHMTPNQTPAQLNPATKRSVEGQAINQSMNQQTSPTKRQRISDAPYGVSQMNQRQPQQPNQQIPINQNLMLTTPANLNGVSASPDLSAKRHLTNGKTKSNNNQQLQQLARPQQQQQQQQQVTPVNKTITHVVNPQINPMSPNQMPESELVSQINTAISSANESLNNIFNMPGINNQVIQQRSGYMNFQQPPNIIGGPRLNNKSMIMEQGIKQRNNIGQPTVQHLQLAYLQHQHQHQHQQQQQFQQVAQVHSAVGPNNNPAQHQQRVKSDAKGTKSQSQIQNSNQSNIIAAPQQVTVTNGVQTQSQQPVQTTATTETDKLLTQDVTSSSLNMNIDEVMNFQTFDIDSSFEIPEDDFAAYFNFENDLGSSNNAGPSASTTNGN